MKALNRERSLLGLLNIYLISCSLFLFSVYVFLSNNFVNTHFNVITMFTVIIFVSYLLLISSFIKYPYSLTMMHAFFCFIFYGIAAYNQYLNNSFIYGLQVPPERLVYILMIVLMWIMFFFLGSKIGGKQKANAFIFSPLLKKKIKFNYAFVVFCTLLSSGIALYTVSQSGFENLLSRSTGDSSFLMESKSGSLLFTAFMRNTVVYGLAIAIVFHQRCSPIKLLLPIQFICCLITNSPLGLSRYNVAIVYLGILLLMIPKIRKNFISVFFLGFIILFPMFNLFRRMSLTEITPEMLKGSINGISENFLSGDFDAFSMIINTVNHIGDYGITFGYQLAGVLFFFVPRLVWPEKPVGSGYMVRTMQGESFVNVSSPLIAESLINFGVIGVIVIAFIVGKYISRIDRIYWEEIKANAFSISYLQILYPFLLPMFFFINRGDLLSTFSYSISHIVIFTLMFWLNNTLFSKLRIS